MSLEDLVRRGNAFRDARDWRQYHTPKDMMVSLSLEAAELLEHSQWKNGEELQTYLEENREEVSHELADILYWVLMIAHDLNVDLETAFHRKMDLNERKYPVEKSRGKATKYDKL